MNSPIREILQKSSLADVVYRLTDAMCVIAGLWLALRGGPPLSANHFLVIGAALAIFYLLAEVSGMYRNWRGVSLEREILSALSTWIITLGVIALGAITLGYVQYVPHATLLHWMLITPGLLVVGRLAIRVAQRVLLAAGFKQHGIAIVGVNELSIQLSKNIFHSPELGMRLVGFFDDRPQDRLPEIPASLGQKVGNLDDLVAAAQDGKVHRIYITFPMRAEERIRRVLQRLEDSTASVYIVPDFFVFELLHARWTDVQGLPVVSVFENPILGIDGLLKRSLDLAMGTLALVACGLPMLLTALAVKLTSPGPIFFRQRRYGLDGREILVWKFRSMTVCEDGAQVKQATKTDSRVTPVGAFIRKTSLDELPQLFNVLGGSMSLVGPRPHATAHNEQYRKLIQGYMLRHKIKPGITGLAQVRGWRGETDTLEKMQRRVECDHEYIRSWSIWLDLKILFQTVFVVLGRQNAY
ncbi:MAG: undecaprenyl-phosphate glucose phosphotransferase [Pirellulaceae bacterium]